MPPRGAHLEESPPSSAGIHRSPKSLIRLEPLPIDPPMTDAARQLIKRFQTAYPFDPFCRLRATASVTALAKAQRRKRQYWFSAASAKAGPASIFSARRHSQSHRHRQCHARPAAVFQFRRRSQPSEIERQIADLVERKLLPSEYANLVDRDAVLWLLQSELGNMIRANHAELIREVPFALIHPAEDCPPSDDPADADHDSRSNRSAGPHPFGALNRRLQNRQGQRPRTGPTC